MSFLSTLQSVFGGIGDIGKKTAKMYEQVPVLGEGVKQMDDVASGALNMPKNMAGQFVNRIGEQQIPDAYPTPNNSSPSGAMPAALAGAMGAQAATSAAPNIQASSNDAATSAAQKDLAAKRIAEMTRLAGKIPPPV
jgi:hypothetical protein